MTRAGRGVPGGSKNPCSKIRSCAVPAGLARSGWSARARRRRRLRSWAGVRRSKEAYLHLHLLTQYDSGSIAPTNPPTVSAFR